MKVLGRGNESDLRKHGREKLFCPEALVAVVEDDMADAGFPRSVAPAVGLNEFDVIICDFLVQLHDAGDGRSDDAAGLQDPVAFFEEIPGFPLEEVLDDVFGEDEIDRIVRIREGLPNIDIGIVIFPAVDRRASAAQVEFFHFIPMRETWSGSE